MPLSILTEKQTLAEFILSIDKALGLILSTNEQNKNLVSLEISQKKIRTLKRNIHVSLFYLGYLVNVRHIFDLTHH